MTEKRFTLCEVDLYEYGVPLNEIMDDGVPISQEKVIDLLNELNDEIRELKKFKECVFEVLDDEIKRNDAAIEWGENQGAGTGAMSFHNEMLKRLKKKLVMK